MGKEMCCVGVQPQPQLMDIVYMDIDTVPCVEVDPQLMDIDTVHCGVCNNQFDYGEICIQCPSCKEWFCGDCNCCADKNVWWLTTCNHEQGDCCAQCFPLTIKECPLCHRVNSKKETEEEPKKEEPKETEEEEPETDEDESDEESDKETEEERAEREEWEDRGDRDNY